MVSGTRDERHYSDILATLLNPLVVGPAAKEFFCLLMAFGSGRPKIDSEGIEYQAVHREYDLGQLRVTGGRGAGKGRIDIFARSNNGILVIENKIDAPEARDQTFKYARAVELCYGVDPRPRTYLLLSPFPFAAVATKFRGIQYPALFDMLYGLKSDPGWNRRGQGLVRLFLDEIGSVFLAPIIVAIDNSLRHLRRAGYDI
jgi:hypothetical protein